MTIQERIQARRDLDDMRAARDLDGLAAALNAENVTEVRECWVDALGILNRCPSGKSILRKLKAGIDADALIAVAWGALVSGKGLDFGADSTRASIDEMTPAIGFTPEEVADIKALADQPVVVTRDQVFEAMFTDKENNGSN